MSKVLLSMTCSIDGYVSAGGSGDDPLYAFEYDVTGLLEEWNRESGAVLMGRTSYAMEDDPDWYADNYEFQLPLFVLTSHPPATKPKESDRLTWTFITDGVHSAVEQAKAAAGDKNVIVVGGASTAQQLLTAGLIDEIQLGVVPVLLGGGLRLFDNVPGPITLEKLRIVEHGPRTDTYYRVLR